MDPARLKRAMNRAAEAAHDKLYNIGPGTSDMSLAFETAEVRHTWREVVLAAICALEDADD
jgi:hypothetical protein